MSVRCRPATYKRVTIDSFGDILTASELSMLLKVQTQTINAACKRGEYPNAVKCGRFWRIPKKDVIEKFNGAFYSY